MGNRICGETADGLARRKAPTFRDGKPEDSYAKYTGPGPFYTSRPDGVIPPRYSTSGLGSETKLPATTFANLIGKVKDASGSRVAFMVERPLPELVDGKAPPALPLERWTQWTYSQYVDDIRAAAKGFDMFGFQRFDSVNIWGFNSPEWVIGALAATIAGGKVAGIYPTDTQDTAAYKIVHSGGSVCLLENEDKLHKVTGGLAQRGDARRLRVLVVWGLDSSKGPSNATVQIRGCGSVKVVSWKVLLQLGNSRGNDQEIDSRIEQTQPGHCAALIYTSGTTGQPKAVMISHDNIVFEASIIRFLVEKSTGFGKEGQERIVSYLPLSHVAGMMVDIVMPCVVSTGEGWCTTFFARPYDLKVGAIRDRLCAARPTIFLGVPLVWEKIADKMRAVGAATTGCKAHLAAWAKDKAVRKARGNQIASTGEHPIGHCIAKRALSKVSEALGLDKCKFGFTGAAPIRVDTLEYFASIGIQINEVYGMSECTGACTFSLNEAYQWGSCGWELPGVEVRVFKVDERDRNKKTECPRAPSLDADDERFMGEICWRGRNNMMGYLANPDLGSAHILDIAKKSAEAIDSEGWLHSGDKGMLTEKGMLKITGRYKELIIGDGGENIAPVPIEDSIKMLCDGISEVMMVGDGRKYNVALFTLKAVGANGEVPGTDELDAGAKRVNPDVATISGAMDDRKWIETVTQAIDTTNKNPKVCINNSFQIQKFTILPTNFSEEGNELTPTKKLKRKNVEDKYRSLLNKMYATEGTYIRY